MLQNGPFDKIYLNYKFWFLTFLILVSLLNIVGFIYQKHLNRNLYVKLAEIAKVQEHLRTHKSMLVLEKSTLESRGRVENVARNKLQMVNPRQIEIVGVAE